MAKQTRMDRRNESRGMRNSYGMIFDDPSAPDFCPRVSMEKEYPANQYNDMSYGKDLYQGAQSELERNRSALRREKASNPQYY